MKRRYVEGREAVKGFFGRMPEGETGRRPGAPLTGIKEEEIPLRACGGTGLFPVQEGRCQRVRGFFANLLYIGGCVTDYIPHISLYFF
jgi:hypothetical protein